MGVLDAHVESSRTKRQQFIKHLLDDIAALEYMLEHRLIEEGIQRIGAEQELCLVNNNWRPSDRAAAILEQLDDRHFTTELAKYNLEINLDPFELNHQAFAKIEQQLQQLLEKVQHVAHSHQTKVLLTGILPSISTHEIDVQYMTELPRYFALNEQLKALRGDDFSMHLTGVDELSIRHDSVMFEACNTSFQMHLQIDPDDFISSYNWSQAIAGPVLGVSVGSPLLFGRELWQETRVALFQQSIDTRHSSYALKDQQARVTFGESWASGSVVDLIKHEVSRYKIILSKDIETSSLDQLQSGGIPKLEALNLHNGTIYPWNRPCYGVGGGKAHLRIENRYIPAGPTVVDQMANFAFWVGLMIGRPTAFDDMTTQMDFKHAKANFNKAAQYGSEALQWWKGRYYTLQELLESVFLPIATKGLSQINTPATEIDRYLQIIRKRVATHTCSQWMVKAYRNNKKSLKQDQALIALTQQVYTRQQSNHPIHSWDIPKLDHQAQQYASKVSHIMSTQLFTVFLDDTASFTLRIMEWKKIHHLPVVDHHENLVGLLTWTHLDHLKAETQGEDLGTVADIMVKTVITADVSLSIWDAIAKMKKLEIGCLPVTQKNQLVGIVTIEDISRFDK